MIQSTPRTGEPTLAGQTVVVIGGTSGIGLETARRARDEGADVIITGSDPDRVQRVGVRLGASIAAFDATDTARLERFIAELPAIDHLLISETGPYSAPLEEVVARVAGARVRPGGTLTFTGADMPALTKSLALELAPVRVNCITQLRDTLVDPKDVAALVVQLMTSTAVTGATYDIDGAARRT